MWADRDTQRRKMSDPCFNKLVITGERVGEVWEKMKQMNETKEGFFSVFVPVPKQLTGEWKFDYWGDKAFYKDPIVFDEGLDTELVVDDIRVPDEELKAFIASCPEKMIYRQGGYDIKDYIPAKHWKMRWKQEAWGDERSNPSPSNEEFDGKTITLQLITRYSPPWRFFVSLSKMYGLTIENTYEGPCRFGEQTYTNGVHQELSFYDTDVPVEDDDGTVYNEAFRALSEEERDRLLEDIYENAGPQELDELQLSPALLRFKKEHSIGCWGLGNVW